MNNDLIKEKNKVCLNCEFYHFHPQKGGKQFCTPRWFFYNKILEENNVNTVEKNQFRIKMLLGDPPKPYKNPEDSCSNFKYMNQDDKLKTFDWAIHYNSVIKVIKNEEEWYLPDEKKKYFKFLNKS